MIQHPSPPRQHLVIFQLGSARKGKKKQTSIWGNDINDNRPCIMGERFMSLLEPCDRAEQTQTLGVLQLSRLFLNLIKARKKEVLSSGLQHSPACELWLLKENMGK